MAGGDPWALEGFIDAIDAWVRTEGVPPSLRDRTLEWVIDDLRIDPYPPLSRLVGGEFGPTWWFAVLPFGGSEHTRVTCVYEINAADHVLTAHTFSELRQPI